LLLDLKLTILPNTKQSKPSQFKEGYLLFPFLLVSDIMKNLGKRGAG
jgi:hypothetical protein